MDMNNNAEKSSEQDNLLDRISFDELVLECVYQYT